MNRFSAPIAIDIGIDIQELYKIKAPVMSFSVFTVNCDRFYRNSPPGAVALVRFYHLSQSLSAQFGACEKNLLQ